MSSTRAWVARAIVVMVALVGGAVMPATAVAARSIALKLDPQTIIANGVSTTTATATVTSSGKAVTDDKVVFVSNGGQKVSATTNNKDGTYTATITSTTMAGVSRIAARDLTAGVVAAATLTQTAGPPAKVALQLAPSQIPADGSSTSVATAAVTDAFDNPVQGASVVFSASDPAIGFGAVTSSGDSYMTTLTSSRTPGVAVITATASASGASGNASLTLTSNAPTPATSFASTVTLSAAPTAPATNQLVTLVALVTAGSNGVTPSGTVTFKSGGAAIAGCANEPVRAMATQAVSEALCEASFVAAASPARLEADFTSSLSNLTSSSTTASIVVGRGTSSTSLDVSNPTAAVGSGVTFTAQVSSTTVGPAVPGGSVEFLDGGRPIPSCSSQRLIVGADSSTASCVVQYAQPGSHIISVEYAGDSNFADSSSGPGQALNVRSLPPRVLGTVKATMRWTFFYTPSYTIIRALAIHDAPAGADIDVTCQGKGCPVAAPRRKAGKLQACGLAVAQHCVVQRGHIVDLRRVFQARHLKAGTSVTVTITRAAWIGKYYRFVVRSGRAPTIHIDCLAPGGTRPGVGC